jgi:dihydrofolate synthase/folylpolyglutamate synthase
MDIRHVKGKTLVLDGAHNFQKMNAFIASFRKLYPEAKPVLLIGLKEGKDIKAILPLIAGLASRIITTNFALAQDTRIMSSQADTLTKYLLDLGFNNVVTQPDQKLAIENMLEGDESICIITGSLYLIGDLQSKKLI